MNSNEMALTTPSGRRIAQEAQLLAEERWIINALKMIRSQRNCLQIERLQLENTLTTLKYGPITKRSEKLNSWKERTPASSIASEDSQSGSCTFDQMSHTTSTYIDQMSSRTNICDLYTTDQTKNLEDGVSNFEELNLSVTNPVWSNIKNPLNFNSEMEEEEDDSEQEGDSMNIDMNMFMNSEQENDNMDS